MSSFAIRQTTIRGNTADTSALLPDRYPRLSQALNRLRTYARGLNDLGLDPIPDPANDKRLELRHPQRLGYGLDLNIEEVR